MIVRMPCQKAGARASNCSASDCLGLLIYRLQACVRPSIAAFHSRALCRSTRARHRAVIRREKPDSGARPDPAGASAQERSARHHDRAEHAATQTSGVHPLPEHNQYQRAFHSIVDLQAAINRFVVEHNEKPKPFTWTADPNKIFATVKEGIKR